MNFAALSLFSLVLAAPLAAGVSFAELQPPDLVPTQLSYFKAVDIYETAFQVGVHYAKEDAPRVTAMASLQVKDVATECAGNGSEKRVKINGQRACIAFAPPNADDHFIVWTRGNINCYISIRGVFGHEPATNLLTEAATALDAWVRDALAGKLSSVRLQADRAARAPLQQARETLLQQEALKYRPDARDEMAKNWHLPDPAAVMQEMGKKH
jgi:hypothetical protein